MPAGNHRVTSPTREARLAIFPAFPLKSMCLCRYDGLNSTVQQRKDGLTRSTFGQIYYSQSGESLVSTIKMYNISVHPARFISFKSSHSWDERITKSESHVLAECVKHLVDNSNVDFIHALRPCQEHGSTPARGSRPLDDKEVDLPSLFTYRRGFYGSVVECSVGLTFSSVPKALKKAQVLARTSQSNQSVRILKQSTLCHSLRKFVVVVGYCTAQTLSKLLRSNVK